MCCWCIGAEKKAMMQQEERAEALTGYAILEAFLKAPNCEMVDRSDFYDFYTIKSFWVGNFGAKI
jgi:hypothetical protein